MRIVFEFYARDKYAPSSRSGQNALVAHIWSVTDNNIVEDIHQPLRLNACANVNKRMSPRTIQDIILRSEVLDKRGIPNAWQVDKRSWFQEYSETQVKATANKHRAGKHKLHKRWSRLMKPRKTWHTLNEETLQRATAAWVWLHAYMEGRGASLPLETRIGDALMSKWVPPCVILRHNAPGGSTIASLGNRVWAALGLPLQELDIDGVAHYTFEAPRAPAREKRHEQRPEYDANQGSSVTWGAVTRNGVAHASRYRNFRA